MKDMNTPEDLFQKDKTTLGIEWKDGHNSEYPVAYLRFRCPCAHCVDEATGERRIEADDIDPDVKPSRIQSVGNYAVNITWDDGHDTGIYPFEYLREICCCTDCASNEDVSF